MTRPVIFIDDGGVMNDNNKRASQWQHLVSEFFVPLLGGSPEAWASANRIVADQLLELESWRARIRASANYASFDFDYYVDWLGGMCELAGVPAPPEEECLVLGHRAVAYITSRVHAAFPGVVDTIRTLHQQGYTLHTASGESSIDLAGYLGGMGVRDCFGRLYGLDLIDTFKEGPEYYERIFADCGVSPTDALVIDDSPQAINWAAQLGARTLLVNNSPHPETGITLSITSLGL